MSKCECNQRHWPIAQGSQYLYITLTTEGDRNMLQTATIFSL